MYQGTRWVILKEKKQSRKSHAWAPLRIENYELFNITHLGRLIFKLKGLQLFEII
jgi:hypothetical protein